MVKSQTLSSSRSSDSRSSWHRFIKILTPISVTSIVGLISVQAIATPPKTEAPLTPVAQAPPSQQTSQITLNGRVFTLPWSQWQTAGMIRIGVSDAALVQLFGAQLLNTSTVTNQPIDWFASATLPLSTRLAAPVRYLDITNLAQQLGWQIQSQGNTLQISTPSAKVLGIRQGQQLNGERLIIDLDRPAPYQVDPQSQELIITLDARTDPALVQSFKAKPGKQIKSLRIETIADRTILRIGIPIALRPRISTLSNPNRIVLDIRPDYLVDRDILWAPGLRWRQRYLTSGTAQFPVVWLEANPRQPGLRLRPILPNPATVPSIAPLIQTARQSQASAAINGGFFNRKNQLPLGAIRRNGEWLSSPILNRGVFAWNDQGEVRVDRLTLQETIVTSTGQQLLLTALNSGYAQPGVARYTSAWGSAYATLSQNEVLLTVQNNLVTERRFGAAPGSLFSIPSNGYLLVIRSNSAIATSLSIGTSLQLESTTSPSDLNLYPNIVGAGPLLIQNGQIVLDAKAEQFSAAFIQELAARSAIGQTADGTILMVTAHNRIGGKGATLAEMAQIMSRLGAVNALNLDGGSSTTLYLGGQILDRPSRSSARVYNGIGVFLQPNP
ncbi:phosphodiester glycosidase family protein [Phormidesmis priestleyi]|uniref:phosphodiester glycosidase family protein n=1 Tax=Phormidesmis priestleyi TaxID=268141 RepID=UPI000941D6A1|nr:phosphodiester glycosidase family protein [Phormidesmis priestleyi]